MHSDPGWAPAFGRLIGRRSQPGADTAIVVLRTVFVGIVTMLMLLVVVVTVTATNPAASPHQSPIDSTVAYLIVAGLGGGALVAATVIGQQSWPHGDAAAMVNRFRTEMFIRVAVSETPILVGMALHFMGAPFSVFLVAAAVSILLVAMVAPTEQAVTRRQERLMAQGSPVDLRSALNSP